MIITLHRPTAVYEYTHTYIYIQCDETNQINQNKKTEYRKQKYNSNDD